ncbi:asparagine synthase (glutamine-hydrolyzing) [candidate division KSB1 bacterium]|nr:asparagine synthase (glutamine-hydrolyzing) [candidate division KSB1 bacterium]
MCGIAGIFSFHQNAPVTSAQIQKMADAIRHRGPDDEGIYVNGNIALGHRRLAIIDLSPDGHQPMAGPDGSTWIIYNGEIYNYLELRAELSAKGHQFKSQSDTEVILHAYQEYGPDCVRHFNGMFAFALWDTRQHRLFLARDRFGVKPLYFYRNAHHLLFASEIKALLAVMETRPSLHQQLVYDFLTLGVLDHTNDTFFAGVHKLAPAHYMLVDAAGREQINRYWDFEVSNEVALLPDKALAEKSQAFFGLFAESVRSHLISDVPVGSCLSGGLDSSAVVAVISRLIHEHKAASVGARQQTFSACYNHSRLDEQPFIDRVIEATGAFSHRVFPTADGFKKNLPQLLWHQEEPFTGTSMYAQWEVMRSARDNGVTVLLDGQGADEQLLGYRKFYVFYVQHLLRNDRRWLGMREMLKHFGSREVMMTLQWQRGLRYWRGAQIGSVALAKQLLQDSFRQAFADSAVRLTAADDLGARIKADMTRFSLPVLLRYEDKNSMAFSREARVPFLDQRLVEYVAGLPLNLKLRDGWTKYCLRRGAQNVVPQKILERKDKIGFATPEEEWFRRALKDDIRQTFQRALFLPEFIKMPDLQNHFAAFVHGKRPLLSSDFFFRFFVLEEWAQTFILK